MILNLCFPDHDIQVSCLIRYIVKCVMKNLPGYSEKRRRKKVIWPKRPGRKLNGSVGAAPEEINRIDGTAPGEKEFTESIRAMPDKLTLQDSTERRRERKGEGTVEYIRVTSENLEREHICCAISNNTDCQVASKKAWLAERMKEGLVFLKADARGKCFIEYLPAEAAWTPVDAPGYMYIDCLWVSGRLKGQGYADDLMDECIRDSQEKGKAGLVILSSDKKRPYLSDKKYLAYRGFQKADEMEPYFELWYLPFKEDAAAPRFHKNTERLSDSPENRDGFVLYYTGQCPFTAKYAPVAEQCARKSGLKFHSVFIDTKEKAQNVPPLFTAYSLYYNGKFITHEILSEKKFYALAEEICG